MEAMSKNSPTAGQFLSLARDNIRNRLRRALVRQFFDPNRCACFGSEAVGDILATNTRQNGSLVNRALAPQPANIIAGRSSRNAAVANAFDALAKSRSDWRARNSYYYACDLAYTRFLVPEGLEVVEIGCGSGALLAGLHPRRGVGVDISGEMIAIAKTDYPSLEFVQADAEAPGALDQLGVFDVVLISDTVGMLEDIASFFRKLSPS